MASVIIGLDPLLPGTFLLSFPGDAMFSKAKSDYLPQSDCFRFERAS